MNESLNLKHTIVTDYTYKRSYYLDGLHSAQLKKVVCKLRIGHNNLGYSIKNMQKKCPYCNTETETLEHALLHCTEYESGRKILFKQIEKQYYYAIFQHSSDKEKILNMMDFSPDTYMWNLKKDLCKYLKYIDDKRHI